MYRNAEYYPDPTAGIALAKIELEEKRKRKHMTQKEFYKSRAWRRAREGYIARRKSIDGGICEVCRRELGFIVHHKTWLNDQNVNDPSISLSFSNLRYECQTCHNKETNPANKASSRVAYGANGEIIPLGDY